MKFIKTKQKAKDNDNDKMVYETKKAWDLKGQEKPGD